MSGIDLVYAFLAGLQPSLIWLVFWTREDNHPEPRWLIFSLFLGGMASVVVAVIAENYIAGIVSDPNARYVLWAAVEEILKIAVVLIVALHTVHYDEPIDAMMYCITVALGFAALENAFFLMSPLSTGDITRSIVTADMRFIGAVLVHVVSSAFIGFTIGYAFYRSWWVKCGALIVGILGAIAIHAAFNISITNGDPMDILHVFAWIWGAVVILIVLFEEVKAVRPQLL